MKASMALQSIRDNHRSLVIECVAETRVEMEQLEILAIRCGTHEATLYAEIMNQIIGITTNPTGEVLKMDGKDPFMSLYLFQEVK